VQCHCPKREPFLLCRSFGATMPTPITFSPLPEHPLSAAFDEGFHTSSSFFLIAALFFLQIGCSPHKVLPPRHTHPLKRQPRLPPQSHKKLPLPPPQIDSSPPNMGSAHFLPVYRSVYHIIYTGELPSSYSSRDLWYSSLS